MTVTNKSTEANMGSAYLRSLSQQQAAALIGKRASWLRDNVDAPRNADGNYNAIELVKWAMARVGAAELRDTELERVKIVTEYAAAGLAGSRVCAEFAAMADDLAAKYGPAGLLAILQELTASARESVVLNPGDYATPTENEIRKQCQLQLESRLRNRTRTVFDQVVRCDRCKKYRSGNRWLTSNPLPTAEVNAGICPKCEE